MQNYRIGKTIGVGAFGKVKLAVHELTGQKVAVKILNRKKLKKMEMGEKVRTEIQILRLFHHPHIIRLYEVIDTPTDIYSVMEYVSGGELFDYIVSRGRLDEREARYMFQQIVSGVEYCHHHMVVHRDLKPENLLLDADHRVKLADFGLSNVMRDGQFLKTSCGSPNYAAPEVISGNLYAGPEVDVWSCGVILYAILCGSLPFDDENIRNLFKKIKGGIYTIPSYVSESARDLLTRMLVVDPIKRISIADIRQHKWFQTNLPLYLTLSAEKQIERTQTIDEGILQDVTKLGVNFVRDQVLAALSVGSELLTSRKMSQHVEARQMAVSYHLLLDQKNRQEHNIDSVAPRSNEDKNEGKEGKNLYADGRIDKLKGLDGAPQSPSPLPSLPSPTPPALTASSGQWSLGRWSKDDPQRIMNELYRTLKNLNFEWKVMSVFKIKARHPAGLVDKDGQAVDSMDVVKIQMQLYKAPPPSPTSSTGAPASTPGGALAATGAPSSASTSTSASTAPASASSASASSSSTATTPNSSQIAPQPSPIYVLDMTKLYGQMFLHLDFCAKILSQLRLSPVSNGVMMSGLGIAPVSSLSPP